MRNRFLADGRKQQGVAGGSAAATTTQQQQQQQAAAAAAAAYGMRPGMQHMYAAAQQQAAAAAAAAAAAGARPAGGQPTGPAALQQALAVMQQHLQHAGNGVSQLMALGQQLVQRQVVVSAPAQACMYSPLTVPRLTARAHTAASKTLAMENFSYIGH